MSFVVFSLPRSRSAWLSVFLSYQGRQIGHDIGIDCRTPAEFIHRIGDGTCETGAAFAWRLVRRALPEARFVVVRRPRAEVVDSLCRFGFGDQTAELTDRDRRLDEIAAQPGTLSIDYADLATEGGAARAFEHCLAAPFDPIWRRRLEALNIQVDMPKMIEKLRRNHDDIQALKRLALTELADV